MFTIDMKLLKSEKNKIKELKNRYEKDDKILKNTLTLLFERLENLEVIPEEVLEIELLESCSRIYIVDEHLTCIYVYESFPIYFNEDDFIFETTELINLITAKPTLVLKYKSLEEFEIIIPQIKTN